MSPVLVMPKNRKRSSLPQRRRGHVGTQVSNLRLLTTHGLLMHGVICFDHGVPKSHILRFILPEGLHPGYSCANVVERGLLLLKGGFTLEGAAAMKRLVIVVCLAGAVPGSKAVAADWFPWFHTRPKPVLLDDQSSRETGQSPVAPHSRVPYHGTAVYPGSGRLYFKDATIARCSTRRPRSLVSVTCLREPGARISAGRPSQSEIVIPCLMDGAWGCRPCPRSGFSEYSGSPVARIEALMLAISP